MHTTHRLRRFCVHNLTPRAFNSTVLWALALSIGIVVAAAFLGRAARNMEAALTDKPDIAIYLLLKDQDIGKTTLLRENDEGTQRDYLAETDDGQMLVTLKRGETQWYVAGTERMRE